MPKSTAYYWFTLLAFVWQRHVRRFKERREGSGGVLKETLKNKKVEGESKPVDRRLSTGGIWTQTFPPHGKIRIVQFGAMGTGVFKGLRVVRCKPFEGGSAVNYKEEDFLALFQPFLAAVRED
jgi:hypothetical protein